MKKNKADTIIIEEIELFCIIGVNQWERETPQRILVDLVLETDLSSSIKTDKIANTVNYRDVVKKISRLVKNSNYKLIESLAGTLADECLSEPLVTGVTVTVKKPGAVRFSKSVGVEIHREK